MPNTFIMNNTNGKNPMTFSRSGGRNRVSSSTARGEFFAPNIYEWDFEGATDAIASGAFHDGVGVEFLVSAADDYNRDVVDFSSGAQSVKRIYSASESNQGNGLYLGPNSLGFNLAAQNLKSCYVAFRHKFDASADLGDPWKGIRFETAIGGGHSGTWNPNTRTFFWDNIGASTTYTTNVGTMPTAIDSRGLWHHYEFYWDISDETNWKMVLYIWIDGVLYFEYPTATATTRDVGARSTLTLTQLQIGGTVNRLDTESTQWFDDFKMSTTRIGDG